MFHGGGGISDINMICILSHVEMSRILSCAMPPKLVYFSIESEFSSLSVSQMY